MRAAQRRGAIYGPGTTWNARQGRRRGRHGVSDGGSVRVGHELEEGDNPDTRARRVSEAGERGEGASVCTGLASEAGRSVITRGAGRPKSRRGGG